MGADQMIYILSGSCDYYSSIFGTASTMIRQGKWACQPALWLRWVHRGRLMARTSTELLGVDVGGFHEIIQDLQLTGDCVWVATVRRYAQALCDYFANSGMKTDIWFDDFEFYRLNEEVLSALPLGSGKVI